MSTVNDHQAEANGIRLFVTELTKKRNHNTLAAIPQRVATQPSGGHAGETRICAQSCALGTSAGERSSRADPQLRRPRLVDGVFQEPVPFCSLALAGQLIGTSMG